eukprot:gnl/Dysnectes_brevis/3529_a4482_1682.p1 GENE.gnl/Dysnectes_brevis/3529_a4482_1682~~gnl/Dysnectes_brevis/3529_a4482_1682.p1  ORF type:complete len:158 (+),score=28.18 gnl/Dysnectes_brevis/3529_a4482_1682:37-510(+)
MFFKLKATEIIHLPPEHFHQNFLAEVQKAIRDRFEGRHSAKYGTIVCIQEITVMDYPILQPTLGHASFHVSFNMLVEKAVKNEVVWGRVTEIEEVERIGYRVRLQCGTMKVDTYCDFKEFYREGDSICSSDRSVKYEKNGFYHVKMITHDYGELLRV